MKLDSVWVRRAGFGLLGIVLLATFAFVVVRTGPFAPVRVTVVTVADGSVTPALFGIGTVEARRSYLIGPTAAGRVLKVHVDVGETVKAGQLLAEMDPVDLDERVSALDASMARASSAVSAAEAQRQDAQARRQLAAINARRYVDLGEKKFVSASVVEAKQQEQTSADAAVTAAEANLAGARQDIARLRAEREGLRQQRQNIRLLAPADGVVTARDAEPGSTVVAGQAAVRLVDPASLWVKVRFDQGRSAGLAVGLPAEIVLRSRPASPLAGKVVRLELLSDSVTEERIAQVAFDSVPSGISLGELAEVTLQLPASQTGPVLPNASIRQRGEQAGVWLLRAGALQFVPLRLGSASLDGTVQVREGLQAGDRVIVHSEKELAADSRIKVVESIVGKGA
ncbi:MAG: efflux RND transporter periplasmic adaptor subunit [Betaproteobacteria bacterium]|jgi:HlyD family secretion protein|nr:efflux RND transporter periplasmic adaptor subunit [Betaproteobacteria bacterium]